MSTGSVVKILLYLFAFSMKNSRKNVEVEQLENVGRKGTDFGFIKQRVCNREQLSASLAFCYL